ncbi:MAG: Fe-S protein assembly co-chaperone HscB [Bacteroidia bacterium]|nr:Fe-S protein assembly co-chaperone HscB [Bacteroidia bacterium]
MNNFFKFYQVEEKFFIDEAALRTQFLEISKAHHPDFYINDEERYEAALNTTSINNKAYKTLTDFNLRCKYILELNEVLQESQNAIPQTFLMEMMDINETIMDLKMEPDSEKQSKLNTEVNALETKLSKELQGLALEADKTSLGSAERKELLEKVKEIYLKQKYVLRIKESVNTFAP